MGEEAKEFADLCFDEGYQPLRNFCFRSGGLCANGATTAIILTTNAGVYYCACVCTFCLPRVVPENLCGGGELSCRWSQSNYLHNPHSVCRNLNSYRE